MTCSHVDPSFECRYLAKNTFQANCWSSKDAKIAKMTKIPIFSQNLHEKPISFPNVGPNGLEMGFPFLANFWPPKDVKNSKNDKNWTS